MGNSMGAVCWLGGFLAKNPMHSGLYGAGSTPNPPPAAPSPPGDTPARPGRAGDTSRPALAGAAQCATAGETASIPPATSRRRGMAAGGGVCTRSSKRLRGVGRGVGGTEPAIPRDGGGVVQREPDTRTGGAPDFASDGDGLRSRPSSWRFALSPAASPPAHSGSHWPLGAGRWHGAEAAAFHSVVGSVSRSVSRSPPAAAGPLVSMSATGATPPERLSRCNKERRKVNFEGETAGFAGSWTHFWKAAWRTLAQMPPSGP